MNIYKCTSGSGNEVTYMVCSSLYIARTNYFTKGLVGHMRNIALSRVSSIKIVGANEDTSDDKVEQAVDKTTEMRQVE